MLENNVLIRVLGFFGLLLLMDAVYPVSLVPEQEIQSARARLTKAIQDPEYMLNGWIRLPTSPDNVPSKVVKLHLRDAILLALRYNPAIQNAELDRVIQRYQLRQVFNEFEMQYALSGSAVAEQQRFQGIGTTKNTTALATPEIRWKNLYGGLATVDLNNNFSAFGTFSPVLQASYVQPLLRGFGRDLNSIPLLNAKDTEFLNKLGLKQSVSGEITQVMTTYRSLIISGYNLDNQKRQLVEAERNYKINQKKIAAGVLEPTANIQQAYQIETLKLQAVQGENDFHMATMALLQVIGLSPEMRLEIPRDVQIAPKKTPLLKDAIQVALTQNVSYLAQKQLVIADERFLKIAQNEQLWQLDAGVNLQSGVSNNVDGNNGIAGIYTGRNVAGAASLTLTIPLNDVNRKSALIRAKIQLEKEHIALKAAERGLIIQVTNVLSSMNNLAQQWSLAKRQVALARQSYELEQKKQRVGISTSLDVSNTQNQYLQAQTALINAKIAYLNQWSQLDLILGKTLETWQIRI